MPLPESRAELERELEHYQEMLHEFDRSLGERLSRGGDLSLEQRRERSRIMREMNRLRRLLYRMKKGVVRERVRRVTLQMKQSEYNRLQALAEEEGLTLPAYIRAKLFPGA